MIIPEQDKIQEAIDNIERQDYDGRDVAILLLIAKAYINNNLGRVAEWSTRRT